MELKFKNIIDQEVLLLYDVRNKPGVYRDAKADRAYFIVLGTDGFILEVGISDLGEANYITYDLTSSGDDIDTMGNVKVYRTNYKATLTIE